MRRIPWLLALAAGLVLAGPLPAAAKLRVAASTNDLASIAASVGGERIEVFAIARPNSDPHRVEALPSYMVKVSRAELYFKVGLGLDQWADAIIDGSRNPHIKIIDCSQDVAVLEKPTGAVNASMGDVHPNGNPHYWLDPRNGGVVAHTIAKALGDADPTNAAAYEKAADAFAADAEAAWKKGKEAADRMAVKDILTYHRSWPYFANAFGLAVQGTIEPVPGIPPTAKHLAELIETVKGKHIGVLVQEPYFSMDASKFMARQTGIRAVTESASCDQPVAGSYLAHIADVVAQVTSSPKGTP